MFCHKMCLKWIISIQSWKCPSDNDDDDVEIDVWCMHAYKLKCLLSMYSIIIKMNCRDKWMCVKQTNYNGSVPFCVHGKNSRKSAVVVFFFFMQINDTIKIPSNYYDSLPHFSCSPRYAHVVSFYSNLDEVWHILNVWV